MMPVGNSRTGLASKPTTGLSGSRCEAVTTAATRLSGGQCVFGVGFGWNADEFPTHGVPFGQRHAIVAEKIELMTALWTRDEASYQGEYVSLAPSWAWPKPVQSPYPPIYLGGNGPRTMAHAARRADGWYPTPPGDDPLLTRSIPRFRELLAGP
jgi:alkanesulfonate monooxygenase SsuD/methylene tetrahydromethanopterin reductase-like flavin-dependent oxidoreductase (luciferase family)